MVKTFEPADGMPVGPAAITRIVVDDVVRRRYRGEVLDDWPLLRSSMSLDDEQWFACPEGWVEVTSDHA